MFYIICFSTKSMHNANYAVFVIFVFGLIGKFFKYSLVQLLRKNYTSNVLKIVVKVVIAQAISSRHSLYLLNE